ncbi:SEC9 Protein transport protein SEC9 [Candida maltosa Xu316]
MGIKKMFQKKDPTEDEIREELSRVGISTRSNNTRQEKFGAFKNYAQERAQMRPQMGPVGGNPYANINSSNGSQNPYANNNNHNDGAAGDSSSPYGNNGSPYGGASTASPYSSSTKASNPYGGSSSRANSYNNKSAATAAPSTSSPYAQSPYSSGRISQPQQQQQQQPGGGDNPYAMSRMSTRQSESVTRTSTRQTQAYMGDTDSVVDLNAMPSNQMFDNKKPIRRNRAPMTDYNLDLNDDVTECGQMDDLNLDLSELPEDQEQVNSEDEEVEAIKQDIKFVKQESVQSTRNTLRMAQEADASGTNTLAETQTSIADEKVKELKRLNRSIFIPAAGNPFNRKSRLRQQEEKIKNQKAQEKYLRETNRQEMYQSEQRIKQGITNNSTSSDVYNKYQDERYLSAAQRYQFENDSEDDDMEKEIASNLDQIGNYAKKLHGIANTMSTEVESQNERLKKIEENADKLDINVHMNTTRLNNIR